MGAPRANRVADAVSRLKRQGMSLAADARSARLALGWTQGRVAFAAGVGQSTISRFEAGDIRLGLDLIARIHGALGLDLAIKSYPGRGVALRDSGQLAMAAAIRAQVFAESRIAIEVPTDATSGRAADMVIFGHRRAMHLELFSGLSGFEGHLRAGHLKRAALEHEHRRSFAFVLVLLDTPRNRAAVAAYQQAISAVLPAGSREIWRAIREGTDLERDGLLWVRMRPPPRDGDLPVGRTQRRVAGSPPGAEINRRVGRAYAWNASRGPKPRCG